MTSSTGGRALDTSRRHEGSTRGPESAHQQTCECPLPCPFIGAHKEAALPPADPLLARTLQGLPSRNGKRSVGLCPSCGAAQLKHTRLIAGGRVAAAVRGTTETHTMALPGACGRYTWTAGPRGASRAATGGRPAQLVRGSWRTAQHPIRQRGRRRTCERCGGKRTHRGGAPTSEPFGRAATHRECGTLHLDLLSVNQPTDNCFPITRLGESQSLKR